MTSLGYDDLRYLGDPMNKAIVCPDCAAESRFNFIATMELGPGEFSDETAFQLLECAQCALKIAAVYEESRRGRLRSETVSHKGYRTEPHEWLNLKTLVSQCSSPNNKSCLCPAHAHLRRELTALRKKQSFPIQLKTSTL